MRRGINIRKKKKIISNEINKKSFKLLILSIIVLLICISIYAFFFKDIFIKVNLEKDNLHFSSLNNNIPFSLRKIVLFSSATAESGSINQLLSLDISQYCDIGIYINTLEDTNVSISYLYKKSIIDLGKSSFNNDNIINDRFDFNVINLENDINYNNYEIYCDGSTPLSLGFYNKNIKTKFITEKSEILYNGSLLKEALIPSTSLNCNISFTINIITNLNEHYICNVNFDIPLEDENGSISDIGYVTQEINSDKTNNFIRIK